MLFTFIEIRKQGLRLAMTVNNWYFPVLTFLFAPQRQTYLIKVAQFIWGKVIKCEKYFIYALLSLYTRQIGAYFQLRPPLKIINIKEWRISLRWLVGFNLILRGFNLTSPKIIYFTKFVGKKRDFKPIR